jgi:hypothetical protein
MTRAKHRDELPLDKTQGLFTDCVLCLNFRILALVASRRQWKVNHSCCCCWFDDAGSSRILVLEANLARLVLLRCQQQGRSIQQAFLTDEFGPHLLDPILEGLQLRILLGDGSKTDIDRNFLLLESCPFRIFFCRCAAAAAAFVHLEPILMIVSFLSNTCKNT